MYIKNSFVVLEGLIRVNIFKFPESRYIYSGPSESIL